MKTKLHFNNTTAMTWEEAEQARRERDKKDPDAWLQDSDDFYDFWEGEDGGNIEAACDDALFGLVTAVDPNGRVIYRFREWSNVGYSGKRELSDQLRACAFDEAFEGNQGMSTMDDLLDYLFSGKPVTVSWAAWEKSVKR